MISENLRNMRKDEICTIKSKCLTVFNCLNVLWVKDPGHIYKIVLCGWTVYMWLHGRAGDWAGLVSVAGGITPVGS